MKKYIRIVIALTLLIYNFTYDPYFFRAMADTDRFLKLPFSRGTAFKISEGWLYSTKEKSIHHISVHKGIDFAIPYGVPIYASADGYALSSSHIKNNYASYQGKSIGYSYGNFVRLWHPEKKIFTQYSHLSRIDESIPYLDPIEIAEDWLPTRLHDSNSATYENEGRFVRQGELLGYSGDSGLSWGYQENPLERPNPEKFPSWDEPHLHFEVFVQNPQGNTKKFIDPFGIYGSYEKYEIPINSNNSLWMKDGKEHLEFAQE